MRVSFLPIISLFLFSACIHVRQIGELNMVSNRNIETSEDYVLIATYKGAAKNDLKKATAVNLQQAVDNTVKGVPGGEYLMNVRVFLVTNRRGRYRYAVEGDVWGKSGEIRHKGIAVGDKVTMKKAGKYKDATVVTLIDANHCLIEFDDGKRKEVEYEEILKQ